MSHSELRKLHFQKLKQAIDEAYSLLESGYEQRGTWSLGQICCHLRLTQDPSIDGYPRWLSWFAFVRPFFRKLMLPKVLSGNSPRGVRTLAIFVPPSDSSDATELKAFAESVERFLAHTGPVHPHPGFGRLEGQELEALHAAHAAHHLRFLDPANQKSVRESSSSGRS